MTLLDRDTAVTYHRPESENLLQSTKSPPVTLGPGWESRHSNSDLVHSSKGHSEESAPRDRCNLLLIILLLHGVGTLMPWNMFITAKEFFTDVKLDTNLIQDKNSPEYQELKRINSSYLGYIIMAFQVPNLVFNILNLFVRFGAQSLGPRIVGSLLIENILFVLTLTTIMIDTSGWPIIFFYSVLAIVVCLGSAGGIYQNSIYGLAANLPGKYTGAIVLGTNISGTLISLMSILTTFVSPSPKTAAIYYFISALFILLLCLDTYFALPLLRIFRHYQKKHTDHSIGSGKPSIFGAFNECWFNCLNVFLCFLATLTCYPVITADITAIDENFPVSRKYFVKIFCYLLFNLFAMIGNLIPMWIKFPRTPRQTFIPVLLRLLFIPFFLMCNFKPNDRVMDVWFSDYLYIGGMIIFALTHGHFSCLTMMQATHNVSDKNFNIVGQMAALFLVTGIFLGGNSTFFIQDFTLK